MYNFLLISILVVTGLFVIFNLYQVFNLVRYFLYKQKTLLLKESSGFSNILKNIFKYIFNLRSLKGIKKLVLVKWSGFLLIINAVLAGAVVIMLFNLFPTPKINKINLQNNQPWLDLTKPLVIDFKSPISQKDLKVKFDKDLKGEWKYKKAFFTTDYIIQAQFQPTETLFPGEDIELSISNLKNYLNKSKEKKKLIFSTFQIPEIQSTTPEDMEKGVAINTVVDVNFSMPMGSYVKWDFETSNKNEFTTENIGENGVRLKFNKILDQDGKYTVKIFRTLQKYNIKTKEVTAQGEREEIGKVYFETVGEPFISSYEPKGGNVKSNTNIKIVFDQPMDKASVESNLSFSPNIAGTRQWESDKVFVLKPTGLSKATTYKISLKKGVKSAGGGFIEKDFSYSFSTIGRVVVSAWSPRNGQSSVSSGSTIKVTFNQEVDHGSAQSKFSISPSTAGTFSWSGNSMTFKPNSGLPKNTIYRVTMNSGVKSVYGLDSTAASSITFYTQYTTFVLNVPIYNQTHRFTCNVTAARQVLAFKGIYRSEMGVYNAIPHTSTPCNPTAKTWGDPYIEYVGNIDGNVSGCRGSGNYGYGVYWDPIANYIRSQGVSATVRRSWNYKDMVKEVAAGHPVIIWWQNQVTPASNISWKTPGGKSIYAIDGMHSEIVVGFVGPVDNPTSIIVNDTWRGRRTFSVARFNSYWGYFNRTGIVIY